MDGTTVLYERCKGDSDLPFCVTSVGKGAKIEGVVLPFWRKDGTRIDGL